MIRARLLLALAVAAVAVGGIAPMATAPATRAATPDLTLVSDTAYEVEPELGRVRVTVDITATNHLRDTVTRRFFFDRAYLAVLPGTRGFTLTSDAGAPSVRVVRRTRDQTLLLLSFGRRLGSGRSATFQLRFELPDPGGSETRDIRIGTSLVSFPVWAFASNETPGSRVTVTFPAGFEVHSEVGDLSAPTTDVSGRTILRSETIRAPLRFYAFLVADRPGSYSVTPRSAEVGGVTAQLVIRGWPDDAAWVRRVGDLFTGALPALGELTGLPWTWSEPLVVQEAVSRTVGGYAGLFDPAGGRVEVAYYAPPVIVLHEAAHAWFNGSLLADRWANEGFASYYAVAVAGKLDLPVRVAPLTPALQKAKLPLNAWEAVGRGPRTTEEYGYAASYALARLIAERAGEDGLRDVWRAAAGREAAYRPDDGAAQGRFPDELRDEPPDWRGLLDLLEVRTGHRFDDLWADWVVRPEEAVLLADRRAALDEYARVLEAAGGWVLPRTVREALGGWQFDQARALLADARRVLDQHVGLAAAARDAGLRLPPTMETMFEGTGGFGAASSEAVAELRTVEAFVEAVGARPMAPDAIQQLGLLGMRPEASIAAASAAFERGDLVQALRATAEARATWLAAGDVGRTRALSAAAVVLLVGLTALWLAARVRYLRRRRRPARAPMAHRP